MTALQQAALDLIKKHGTLRAAADAVGMDHTLLYRISKGQRKRVYEETAAKLGLTTQWRRLSA